MMKLLLEIGTAYCYTPVFEINGIKADSDEFGNQDDQDTTGAEDYCCGDMQFTPSLCTQQILDKYSIDINDYNIICEKLREGLSFGECGWCS